MGNGVSRKIAFEIYRPLASIAWVESQNKKFRFQICLHLNKNKILKKRLLFLYVLQFQLSKKPYVIVCTLQNIRFRGIAKILFYVLKVQKTCRYTMKVTQIKEDGYLRKKCSLGLRLRVGKQGILSFFLANTTSYCFLKVLIRESN